MMNSSDRFREAFNDFFRDSVITITGGAGSVGKALVLRLLQLDVREVRCIDFNENALFDFEHEMKDEPRFKPFHANIANEWQLKNVLAGSDYVFHCAALKHVPSCERSPFSAVETNVLGAQTIIQVAQDCGVRKVLFTSSDKAVAPTNIMGASKLMGERLFSAANLMAAYEGFDTRFVTTRFGNVAGSHGSVIPLFCRQIEKGGPVTVTDEGMSRFMMSLEQAVDLVIGSLVHSHGGEIFITKMPALWIMDLARAMIDMLAPLFGHDPHDIAIKVTGIRPGEKLWEDLCTHEEMRTALEGDDYICILPPHEPISDEVIARYAALGLRRGEIVYSSKDSPKMTVDEIKRFLMLEGVLPEGLRRRLQAQQP